MVRTSIIAATAVAIPACLLGCLLALASCSSGDKVQELAAPVDPAIQTEILSLPMDGVSPALATQLKDELLKVLAKYGTAKRGATPPRTAANQVTDFAVEHDSALSVNADWSYVCLGDYDQNGEVNVADITEVGRHFGKTTASPDWEEARLADGDGNGEINISDITPVGLYFNNQVAQYTVYRSLDQADYPASPDAANGPGTQIAGTRTMPGAPSGPGGWMQFSAYLDGHSTGMYYWVRPVDASGELGAASNIAYADLENLPWLHTIGWKDNDAINDVAVDSFGYIYTVGTTYDPEDNGTGSRMLFQKYHPDGTLVFSKTWRMSDGDTMGTDIAIDSSNHVYTSGTTLEVPGGDKQIFVQKWSAGGSQHWSSTLGGSGDERTRDLMVRGSQVYLVGTSDSYSSSSAVLLVKLNTDGELQWCRRWTGAGYCYEAVLGYRITFFGDTVYIACSTTLPSTNLALVLVRYTPEGSLVDCHQMSMSPSTSIRPVGMAVVHNIKTFSTTVYIASRYDNNGFRLLLSAVNGTFDAVYNKSWSLPGNIIPSGMLLDDSGGIVVTGWGDGLSAGTSLAYVSRFERDTGLPIAASYYGIDGDRSRFYGAQNYNGGLLLWGYAPDATGTWGTVTGSSSTPSHLWGEVLYNSYDTDPSLFDMAYGFIHTPLNQVNDTGGGYDDALVCYHSLPE